jgi:hypothetical protein
MVLALKAPDDPAARGVVLRLRETAGRSGPLAIATGRARRAVRLDLLERERLDLPVHGFGAVRLEQRRAAVAPDATAPVRLSGRSPRTRLWGIGRGSVVHQAPVRRATGS